MDEIIYLIEKFLTFIPVPFLALVNISITAGWIVLAVVLLRLLFRKAPKWLNCVLWGIVALRLVFPFSIESVFSLIPSAQTVDPTLPYLNEFTINSGIAPIDNAVNTQYADFVPMAERTVDVTIILACVWLLGVAAMLIYAFASWAKLRHSLRTATKKEGNIYHSEFVKSPFVLGLIRPKIYIPYSMDENDLPLVIAHEQAHIKRLDHLIKPFGYLLLSVHWFNPLLWVAYVLLCRDIESACDEKVVKKLTSEQRKSYSTALLNASISRKSVAACPLAFGETGVKERIKGVMSYKKPAFWVVIAAIAVCVVAAVCFLTNPKDANPKEFYDNGQRIRITAEVNGAVSEEKFIILNEGQNAQLSNGTKFTVDAVNLQTGETTLKLKGTPIKNESGKSPDAVTFYDTDMLSYFTQDGKTKISISCVRVQMLEECISQEIIKHNTGNYLSGEYACEANTNLLTEISKKDTNGNIKEVTVYLMSMYQEYSLENGYIVEKGGNITPIALSFSVGADGEYSLAEYWEPGMGRGYIENLKAKFPRGVDYDTQTYVESLERLCRKQASAYFNAEFEADDNAEEYTTTAVNSTMYTTLETLIVQRNSAMVEKGDFSCAAFEILKTEKLQDNKIKLYLLACYESYSFENQKLELMGAVAESAVITLDQKSDGTFSLIEYYVPVKGDDSEESKLLDKLVFDYDGENLSEICRSKAEARFGENKRTTAPATEKTELSSTPLVSDCQLRIVKSKSGGMTWLTNEAFYNENGYHVYLYCLDECYVTVKGKEYEIGEALNNGTVTADAIVEKAKNDALGGKAVSKMYKDGGSTVISYDDGGTTEYKSEGYAIIKKNTIDGNKDVFIGPEDMNLNQVNAFMQGVNNSTGNSISETKPDSKNEINGVTADISPEAEPSFSGKIKEINDGSILVEVGYNDDGIPEGSLTNVRLGTVLSYAPDIDSLNLKEGDYILVVYDGRIMETYPLQVDAYAVYKAVT